MPDRYAELKLYFAFVAEGARGEGRYEREPTSKASQLAVNRAKEIIEKYLYPDWSWGLHFSGSGDDIARNEQEALFLISFAQAHLKNVSGQVVPFDRMHGSTRFNRVIRFAKATAIQRDGIVSVMKQSGHLPYTREGFRRDFGTEEEEFMRRNDHQWRKALKFY